MPAILWSLKAMTCTGAQNENSSIKEATVIYFIAMLNLMTVCAISGMTPHGMTPIQNGAQPGLTPGRTPMRDKLNINQSDEFESFEQVSFLCLSFPTFIQCKLFCKVLPLKLKSI